MKPIRKDNEIDWIQYNKCHGGEGIIKCKSLLEECDAAMFRYVHYDDIKKGVSIGVHNHAASEEIYYLVSGKGILIYDGEEYEMASGDVSLCNIGHSHGFQATEDSILLVVG